ncbi:MAG: hypothetical protein HN348_17635 [Proteobacteria bacterium]|nr:hypothetical protein [Pseudomonadota bacterium]
MNRRTLIKTALSVSVLSTVTTSWIWRILQKPRQPVRHVTIAKDGPVLTIIPLNSEDIDEGTHLAG